MVERTEKPRAIIRRLGPGLITAAVVLGPGTIISASRAGADYACALLWVIGVVGLIIVLWLMTGTLKSVARTLLERF